MPSIEDVLVSLLITICIYSLPIFIYRYAILKAPVAKKKAIIITLIYGVIAYLIMSVLTVLTTGNVAGGAIVLWSCINYYVLSKGFENDDSDSGQKEQVVMKEQAPQETIVIDKRAELISIKNEIEKIKNGGVGLISYAQLTEAVIDMDKARNSLKPGQFRMVSSLYDECQNDDQIFEMNESAYAHYCLDIIKKFDDVAPYESYFRINKSSIEALANRAETTKIPQSQSDEEMTVEASKTISEKVIGDSGIKDPMKDESDMAAKQNKPSIGNSSEQLELIEKLSELHKRGILTDEEFDRKKTDILKRL